MGSREELHNVLTLIAPNVYFQPPEGFKMEYPCIIYRRDDEDVKHADGIPYNRRWRYQVTVVSKDPDFAENIALKSLPYSEFDRFYIADQLNHDVYNLFF